MKIFYKQKSKLDFFILNLLFYFKCILESGLPSKHSYSVTEAKISFISDSKKSSINVGDFLMGSGPIAYL